MRGLVFVAVLTFASAARAQELPAEGPRNAVMVSLIAPMGRGVSVGYERAFAGSKLGLVTRAGMRFADGGDYRTRGYAMAAELRYYVVGRLLFREIAEHAMIGLFGFARVSWTMTVLREEDGHQLVGRGHRLGTQLGVGYRYLLGDVIELTPTFAMDVRTDFASGIAVGTRPTVAFGLTLGVLFDRAED